MITVNIYPNDFPWTYDVNLYEVWCMGKLKKAGIPIKGYLESQGVESGVLTQYEDFEKNCKVFVWTE